MNNKLVYGQYKADNYPLKKYFILDIPIIIKNLILEISNKNLAVIRGGLAYVIILNRLDYKLKDLDMAANKSKKQEIINLLITYADKIYINKNSFGDSVITAFWKDNAEFYKLDILLCKENIETKQYLWNGKPVNTITTSYLWMNRLCKIAEKEQRSHEDNKTLNHYNVAGDVSRFILDNKLQLSCNHVEIVKQKINDVENVLKRLISEEDLLEFIKLQYLLIDNYGV